jgi:hypothetical protein
VQDTLFADARPWGVFGRSPLSFVHHLISPQLSPNLTSNKQTKPRRQVLLSVPQTQPTSRGQRRLDEPDCWRNCRDNSDNTRSVFQTKVLRSENDVAGPCVDDAASDVAQFTVQRTGRLVLVRFNGRQRTRLGKRATGSNVKNFKGVNCVVG